MGKQIPLTRENMKAVGMTDEQIEAVLNTVSNEQESVSQEDNITAFDVSKHMNRNYNYSDDKAVLPMNQTNVQVEQNQLHPTTIFDLQSYSRGTIVRFPDFAEGQPFFARVRRPSMLVLAKQGKIPNTLLASANELFSKGGGGLDSDNMNMLADIHSIAEVICESALMEPTYQQIKDAGVELSDDQLMAIFNYTQSGVKALEPFR